jgi:hypothetical protein
VRQLKRGAFALLVLAAICALVYTLLAPDGIASERWAAFNRRLLSARDLRIEASIDGRDNITLLTRDPFTHDTTVVDGKRKIRYSGQIVESTNGNGKPLMWFVRPRERHPALLGLEALLAGSAIWKPVSAISSTWHEAPAIDIRLKLPPTVALGAWFSRLFLSRRRRSLNVERHLYLDPDSLRPLGWELRDAKSQILESGRYKVSNW